MRTTTARREVPAEKKKFIAFKREPRTVCIVTGGVALTLFLLICWILEVSAASIILVVAGLGFLSIRMRGRVQLMTRVYATASLFFFLILAMLFTKRYSYSDIHIDVVTSCPQYGWSEVKNRPRVFDAVPINSEIDILRVRMHELEDVVDTIVIVEAPYTFSGKRKPLFFKAVKDKFEAEFEGKLNIEHVVLPPFEPPADAITDSQKAVARKKHAKSGIVLGLNRAGATDNDIVIVTDLDEIPRSEVVTQLSMCQGWTSPVELDLMPYTYDFGCAEVTKPSWRRGKVIRRSDLEAACNGPWDGRVCTDELRGNHQLGLGLFRFPTSISHAGWHLSYFMTTAKIAEKIGSYAHVERDTNVISNDYIECRIATCTHVNMKDYGYRQRYGMARGPSWVYEQAHTAKNPVYIPYYARTLDIDACSRAPEAAPPGFTTRLRWNRYTSWITP